MIALEASRQTTSSISSSRRSFLRGLAVAGAFGRYLSGIPVLAEVNRDERATPPLHGSGAVSSFAGADESIRPFHIDFPEASLVDLRRRIAATIGPSGRR